jgi:hypothetical protein
MNLGAPELLIIGVVLVELVALAVIVWGAVDAAGQPDWAWQQTGRSRTVWIVVPLVSLLVCGIVGIFMVVVYVASIRPELRRAQGRI